MRIIAISILLILLGVAATAAQGLDEILKAHYEAAAQEKMEKVETMIVTGANSLSMVGMESSFTTYQARPNKVRAEGEIQGSQVIQTFNGEKGWMYAPMMGITEPQEMSDEELNALLSQAEFENPLWKYEEKGSTIEVMDEPEEGAADLLKLTTKEGNVRIYCVDRESHQITAIRTKQVMGGSETEVEILLEDYKPVHGIPVAHTLVTKMNGQVVTTLKIDKVEFNKKINPALFEKPTPE
jgi:outer membrane lipoprotein-sorting protein